jgi:hypothetical protein
MALFIDARIPVVLADRVAVTASDAVLLEGDAAAPPLAAAVGRFGAAPAPHPAGCVCCLPRGKAAEALGRLFLARVRGEVRFFERVVACVQDRDAVLAALADDALVAARFRLA